METIEQTIREIVREEIRRERAAGACVVEYTTHEPAPGVSARVHNEACRSGRIEGARKEGREWRCSREAWHAARTRQPKAPAPVLRLVSEMTDEQLADLALSGGRAAR